jgi:hypothetical protein
MSENSPNKSIMTEDIMLEPTIIQAFLNQSKISVHPGGPFAHTTDDNRSEISESDMNFSSRVKMPAKSSNQKEKITGNLRLDFSKLKK